MEFSLTRDDNADISFATTCLLVSIVDFKEFKQWLYYVIEHADVVPTYFFDILDIKEKFDYTLKRHDVVGFTPEWEGSRLEEKALRGIGYRRFSNYKNDYVNNDAALKALEENPHIEGRFRDMFIFIEW